MQRETYLSLLPCVTKGSPTENKLASSKMRKLKSLQAEKLTNKQIDKLTNLQLTN